MKKLFSETSSMLLFQRKSQFSALWMIDKQFTENFYHLTNRILFSIQNFHIKISGNDKYEELFCSEFPVWINFANILFLQTKILQIFFTKKKFTDFLSMWNSRRFGSYNKADGSILIGDCILPFEHICHRLSTKPQKSGPKTVKIIDHHWVHLINILNTFPKIWRNNKISKKWMWFISDL